MTDMAVPRLAPADAIDREPQRRTRNLIALPGVPPGRIMGIPISLDYSWFLVFALLTWMLADGYYPSEFKNWPPPLYGITGAVTAILFFVRVLLYELGHSFVASRFGISVRGITLFIFGGVAEIGADSPTASAEFSIAIAEPIVSLALALMFSVIQPAFTTIEPLWAVAKYLAYMNFALALFNLIPGFPQEQWPCIPCVHLGDYEEYVSGNAYRGQRWSAFWFSVHSPRSVANVLG